MRTLLACLLIAGLCAGFTQAASAKKPDTPGNVGSTAAKTPKGDSKNQDTPGGRGNADKSGASHSGGAEKDKNDGSGGRDKNERYDTDRRDSGDRTTELLLRAGITALEAHRLAQGERLIGMNSLPPGIRKNLARGKPLPPGIAKKMIPGGMIGKLPVHPGYEWRMLGTDLVLVYLAQDLVADILIDVFK